MSDEQKWFNHYPDQFEIWFPYNGLRYKDWYDIKLHDGTVHEMMYPNSIAWSGEAGRFEDSEVAEIRLVSNIRHPLSKNGNLIKTSWRVEHSYDLFKDWIPADPSLFDLNSFIEDKWQFSQDTFGPNYAVSRVIDHLRKEVTEVAEKPNDLMEWIDIINLAIDGALRTGHKPQVISKALADKLAILKNRDWPDWRTADENAPIEHIRDELYVIVITANPPITPFTFTKISNITRIINDLREKRLIEGAAIAPVQDSALRKLQIQVKQSEVALVIDSLHNNAYPSNYYVYTSNPGKIAEI